MNRSRNVTARNPVFGDNARRGIFTKHSDDLSIEDSECFGGGLEHGIRVDAEMVRAFLLSIEYR